MRVFRVEALLFVRSLKQPVRSGVYGMRGCVRGSSPSPPAALGSLRTCVQGAAAAIVGSFGSSLVRVRVSLPSGLWSSRCVRLFRSSGSREVTEHEACGFGGFRRLGTGGLQDNCGPGAEL
ncbi:hypothetical protein NDU88_002798 [Pleurodeles waltl]|uniref:Uncharacterized protein n=1 Tax=Pleurodeles waltl TaxID=8319 RepID=A0AAV7M1Q0_PLEWA|nr:hypothetical protein NDU88_002798 [Pleurodeles waltl]